MTTVNDVPAEPLIEGAASMLKEVDQITPPEWAAFARTGPQSEKPPERDDWWYVRSAAVLRKVYLNGPIGTERLAALFGGKRDRGSKPYRAVKGSRSVVRTILQQLEEAELVKKTPQDKGRVVTPKGQSLLDNAAYEVRKSLKDELPELAKY